ncbi:zinc metalloproteinase nas-8-like [Brevipalpus obovatus]|uniref:zinc metalloproteinase nas-8-like n=1 Tax=Brevipalpus obovatus TaxID=246614 RepID=UPI003D9EF394
MFNPFSCNHINLTGRMRAMARSIGRNKMHNLMLVMIVHALINTCSCAPLNSRSSSLPESVVISSSPSPASSSSPSSFETESQSARENEVADSKEYYDPAAFYGLNRFEGDILGTYPTNNESESVLNYHAISDTNYLWPNGELVYEIDSSLANHRGLIQQAMQHISSMSGGCIKFKERSSEPAYVWMHQSQGCYSQVGRQGGAQELSLGRGCHVVGVVIHEILHALGFFHHHSRSDRDEFLRINYENINPQAYPQFQKLGDHENQLFTEFDYGSIMIYGSTAFSKDGYAKTMTPLRSSGTSLSDPGYKSSMTDKDVTALKKLYQCGGSDNNKIVITPSPVVDKGGNGGNGGLIGGRSTIYPPLPDFPGIRPINPSIRPIWPTGYPWPKDEISTAMPTSDATSSTSVPSSTSTSTVSPSTSIPIVVVTDGNSGVSVTRPDGSILTPPPPGSMLPPYPPMPDPLPPFNPSIVARASKNAEDSKSQKMNLKMKIK